MKGFLKFIKKQGVVGLAVGFIFGGAISDLVGSLVNDIINPVMGIAIGAAGNLSEMYIRIGPANIMWGSFITVLIDFLTIALIVYFGVTKLGLDKLDPKRKITG